MLKGPSPLRKPKLPALLASVMVTLAALVVPVATAQSEQAESTASQHHPRYGQLELEPGAAVDAPKAGDDLPEGTTFRISDSNADGWSSNIDPTTGILNVTAASDAGDKDRYQVSYERRTVRPGESTLITPQWEGERAQTVEFSTTRNLPEGWRADLSVTTGSISVSAPAEATNGSSVSIPIRVHYADGTFEDVTTTVEVDAPEEDAQTMAETYAPRYPDVTTPADRPKTVEVRGGRLPEDTTFHVKSAHGEFISPVIDANSGRLTLIPNALAEAGMQAQVPVDVEYPDGSSDRVLVQVSLEEGKKREDSGDSKADRESSEASEDDHTEKNAPLPVAENVPDGMDGLEVARFIDPKTGEERSTLPSTPPGEKILVNMSTMFNLIYTGLPFILEMIRDGQIRLPEGE